MGKGPDMGHSKRVYLVTADVHHLLRPWAAQRGFALPPRHAFAKFTTDLTAAVQRAVHDGVEVHTLPSEVLIDGVRGLLAQHADSLPAVVMDHVVGEAISDRQALSFSATRSMAYDPSDPNCPWQACGEHPRPGCRALDEQADQIAERVGVGSQVVTVDDGCSSGRSLQLCARLLRQRGIQVRCAIVGVYCELPGRETFDFPVYPFLTYAADGFADWVCERDFFVGVPHGGRLVLGYDLPGKQLAAFYLDGFGNMIKWASIRPDACRDLTAKALGLSSTLFAGIEYESSRPVMATDVERWPFYRGQPLPLSEGARFTEHLGDLILHHFGVPHRTT